MSVATQDSVWKTSDREFRYQVRRFSLFSQRLHVAQLDRHFTALGTSPEQSEPPFSTMEDVDVFIVRPHPVLHQLPIVSFNAHSVRFVPTQYRRSYIELSGSFDEYLSRFSPKARKNRQREIRSWVQFCGESEPWREYRTPAEMIEFHRLARVVASRSWQAGLRGGEIPDGEQYCTEMQRLASLGRASGHLLLHGDRPVAYVFLVYSADIVLFEYTGFDPGYREHSVGKVLFLKMLEGLFASGRHKVFDFGEGEYAYKHQLATHNIQCADVYYFRYRAKPLLSVGIQFSLRSFASAARQLAKRLP